MSSLRTILLASNLLWICTATSCHRFGQDEIFTKTMGAKAPASVRILESADPRQVSITLFVHFKIDPTDLNALIKASPFGNNFSNAEHSKKYEHFHPPAWWKPESFGADASCYTWQRNVGGEFEESIVIMNGTNNEVFGLFFTSY